MFDFRREFMTNPPVPDAEALAAGDDFKELIDETFLAHISDIVVIQSGRLATLHVNIINEQGEQYYGSLQRTEALDPPGQATRHVSFFQVMSELSQYAPYNKRPICGYGYQADEKVAVRFDYDPMLPNTGSFTADLVGLVQGAITRARLGLTGQPVDRKEVGHLRRLLLPS